MRIEHCVHRPKGLVDIKHVIQSAFSRYQDGFPAEKGFIDIAHNAARTVAGYRSVTKPLMVFAIADGQDVRQHSGLAIIAKFGKDSLRHLL